MIHMEYDRAKQNNYMPTPLFSPLHYMLLQKSTTHHITIHFSRVDFESVDFASLEHMTQHCCVYLKAE